MLKETRLKVFENELKIIQDDDIRKFAEHMLGILPDYFFTIPASSTGKYHPPLAQGEGGLVRHTKAGFAIAESLFPLYNFTEIEKDIIRVSLLLHDGYKNGEDTNNKYTVPNHPNIIAGKIYMEHITNMPNVKTTLVLDIVNNVASHMGQWNTDRNGNEILKKPQTDMEKFVHLCDYIASRKYINMEFDK